MSFAQTQLHYYVLWFCISRVFSLWLPIIFSLFVPEALSNYSGFKITWSIFFKFALQVTIVPLLIVAFCFYYFRRTSVLSELYLITAVAFFLPALLQQKNWNYQFYPVILFLYLCAVQKILDKTSDSKRSRAVSIAIVILIGFVSVQPAMYFVLDGYREDGTASRVQQLAKIIKQNTGLSEKSFRIYYITKRHSSCNPGGKCTLDRPFRCSGVFTGSLVA